MDRCGEQLLEVLHRDVNVPEMDLAVTLIELSNKWTSHAQADIQ